MDLVLAENSQVLGDTVSHDEEIEEDYSNKTLLYIRAICMAVPVEKRTGRNFNRVFRYDV